MTDLVELGVVEAADLIRSGATSSEELVQASLDRIAASDGELMAWVTVDDPTLCAPWSYAGVPAITLPTGLDDDGLPLAVQLAGGSDRLERLRATVAWCEQVVAFDASPR